jgi:hypothetical protein
VERLLRVNAHRLGHHFEWNGAVDWFVRIYHSSQFSKLWTNMPTSPSRLGLLYF